MSPSLPTATLLVPVPQVFGAQSCYVLRTFCHVLAERGYGPGLKLSIFEAWDCGTPECSQSCKADMPSARQLCEDGFWPSPPVIVHCHSHAKVNYVRGLSDLHCQAQGVTAAQWARILRLFRSRPKVGATRLSGRVAHF